MQTAGERRAAETGLKLLVAKFAPEHDKLVGTARRWLLKRLPTAYEVVYEYRDCFVISCSPSEHGYQGVLAIRGSKEGVRLYINQGKGLPDPAKLLRGTAQARWIDLEGPATLRLAEVAALVDLAIARNRVPFARSGRGPVVLRSAAKPSKPRRPA